MTTKKSPTPSVSAKAARLLREFDEAAQTHGLEREWGTGAAVDQAEKAYDRARAALRRYIHQLENKTS